MESPFEVQVAFRYMRSRRKAGISLTSFLTVVAFMLGVAALTVVTSVWNGFEAEFLDKLLGINAHALVLRRHDVFRDHEAVAKALRASPGVEHVAPFVYSEVIAQSALGVQGVVIKGIDPEVTVGSPLAKYVSKDPTTAAAVLESLTTGTPTGTPDASALAKLPGVLIGNDLKEVLHTGPGQVISIISPYGGRDGQARTSEYRVVGIFHSGMFEFDSRMVFIDLKSAQKFFKLYDTVTGLEVWTTDPLLSYTTLRAAVAKLEPDDPLAFEVKDWSVTNRGIFGAVRSQKALISIVLFIIVLVAAFMVMATLILLVLEKRREVAILKALGASDRSILTIFVLDGQIVGIVGCLVGVAVGLAICAMLGQYGLKLDPKVYYLEHLPIVVNPLELVGVCVGAMILATVATLFPAIKAARMKPVDGLTMRGGVRAPTPHEGGNA
ncbi:MAG: ABC transporter permease [Deltaproteobacteria bacterium]|nr:ABC transporter permease [Deltaproteobacteria bacterium]